MEGLPDGPRAIGPKNQVTFPADQLEAIGVAAGQKVWVMLNPDKPNTLVVMPRSVMEEVVRKGWIAAGG